MTHSLTDWNDAMRKSTNGKVNSIRTKYFVCSLYRSWFCFSWESFVWLHHAGRYVIANAGRDRLVQYRVVSGNWRISWVLTLTNIRRGSEKRIRRMLLQGLRRSNVACRGGYVMHTFSRWDLKYMWMCAIGALCIRLKSANSKCNYRYVRNEVWPGRERQCMIVMVKMCKYI